MIDLSRSENRKAVSRRMIKIPIENWGFTMGLENLQTTVSIYDEVDDANMRFSEHWLNVANCFLAEQENLLGRDYVTFTENDIINGATEEYGNYFFPKEATPITYINTGLIPAINRYSSGVDWPDLEAYTTGNTATIINPAIVFSGSGTRNGTFTVGSVTGLYAGMTVYLNDAAVVGKTGPYFIHKITDNGGGSWTIQIRNAELTSEYFLNRAFNALSDICVNGTYGAADTTLTAILNTTDTELKVANGVAAGILNNTCLIVSGNDGGGPPVNTDMIVFVIDGQGTNTLTIRVIGGTGPIAVVGSTVENNNGIIWNDAVRNNLAAAISYPNSAQAVVTYMTTNDLVMEAHMTAQLAAINANDDFRDGVQTRLSESVTDIGVFQADLDLWQALPILGAGGMFNDVGLTPLMTALSSRDNTIKTRRRKMERDMGTVVDDLDGTYSGDDGALKIRYEWLDARINRQYGSTKRSYQNQRTEIFMQSMIDNNTMLLESYEIQMATTRLSADADGTSILHVDEAVDFSAGDRVYIIDELNDEIEAVVLGSSEESNIIELNTIIPSTYKKTELARIYKLL